MKNKIKILENDESEKNKDLTEIKNLINSNTFKENISIADSKVTNNLNQEIMKDVKFIDK